jgi:hypothetical protein
MDNGRFGPPIGSSASGDDQFGYFGGTAAPAMPPALGQFGSAPAGPSADRIASEPQSPFGGTATIQGSPAASYPSASRRSAPWPVIAVAAVLVAALAGGGWWWLHRDAIVLPDHLGALSRNTAFDTGAVSGQMTFQTGNGDIKEALAGYGPSPVGTFLMVARGPGMADAIRQRDQNVSGLVQVGSAKCFAAKGIALCSRTEGDLAVVVETVGEAPTAEETAALVQVAWQAQ